VNILHSQCRTKLSIPLTLLLDGCHNLVLHYCNQNALAKSGESCSGSCDVEGMEQELCPTTHHRGTTLLSACASSMLRPGCPRTCSSVWTDDLLSIFVLHSMDGSATRWQPWRLQLPTKQRATYVHHYKLLYVNICVKANPPFQMHLC
jgi:hypothetical protein